MQLDGGGIAKVLDSVFLDAGWRVMQDGVYFLTTPDNKGIVTLCLLEFASGKTRKIINFEGLSSGRFSVSHDGRTILYCKIDEAAAT